MAFSTAQPSAEHAYDDPADNDQGYIRPSAIPPLDHPSIPVEERPKLTRRLSDLKKRMKRAGYNYEITNAARDRLRQVSRTVKNAHLRGGLIGDGVVNDPDIRYFMEQIVGATHEVAPKAKIMFYSHSVDVRVVVERLFGSQFD